MAHHKSRRSILKYLTTKQSAFGRFGRSHLRRIFYRAKPGDKLRYKFKPFYYRMSHRSNAWQRWKRRFIYRLEKLNAEDNNTE